MKLLFLLQFLFGDMLVLDVEQFNVEDKSGTAWDLAAGTKVT